MTSRPQLQPAAVAAADVTAESLRSSTTDHLRFLFGHFERRNILKNCPEKN
jgi:hypothetical protein